MLSFSENCVLWIPRALVLFGDQEVAIPGGNRYLAFSCLFSLLFFSLLLVISGSVISHVCLVQNIRSCHLWKRVVYNYMVSALALLLCWVVQSIDRANYILCFLSYTDRHVLFLGLMLAKFSWYVFEFLMTYLMFRRCGVSGCLNFSSFSHYHLVLSNFLYIVVCISRSEKLPEIIVYSHVFMCFKTL